jgi:tetratricopeptide (TPR) repeat protein
MAIDEYEKALRLNPQDADTHYNLAIIYDEVSKNPKRAIEHYQKYLELKPDAADIDEVKDWITRLEK